jgi:hypothetical protein
MPCVGLLITSAALTVNGPEAQSGMASALQSVLRVQALLRDWDQKKSNIRDFRCQFEVTTLDRVFRSGETTAGEASGTRSKLLLVKLNGATPKSQYTLFLQRNTARLFNLDTEAVVTIRDDMPSLHSSETGWRAFFNWPAETLRSAASFVRYPFCGIPAAETKRFAVHLDKEDEHYAWIALEPRAESDRLAHTRIHVGVDKKTGLPWHTRFVEPNGNTQTWSIKKREINGKAPVTLESLSKELPQGCKRVWLDEKAFPGK